MDWHLFKGQEPGMLNLLQWLGQFYATKNCPAQNASAL